MGEIGLGLAALGRPEYINIRQDKEIDKSEQSFEENAFAVLDDAYENGVRFFDTAPSYGRGEQFLIDWNKSRGHADVVLSTKWGYTYVADWELGYKGAHEIKEHSLVKLIEQWEQSKLLLSKLEVYQIHSATFESGVLKNLEVLEKLVYLKETNGLKIGLTTSGANQKDVIQEALKISVKGKKLFDSFQVTYNILEQDVFAILQEVKKAGKFIIIKEALANGRVFSKENETLYAKLKKLSIQYNVGMDAIALRFCLDTVQPDVVLSGASNTSQLNENLKALDVTLTTKDIESLKEEKITADLYWEERKQLEWS